MPKNIEQIKIWENNPQKDRISKVVRIKFKFPCTWTILDIEDLKQILREWIKGEELKYPLDKDIGEHNGKFRGRWLLFEEIKKVFMEFK
jgi:hypothetical protein